MKIAELEREIQPSKERVFATELFRRGSAGKAEIELYRGYLQETYHYVKHASRFYAAAASRLPEEYESIRGRLLQYAFEENGHEIFLLNDLKALGVDPDSVRSAQPLVETDALIGFHYYAATFGNPLCIWGNIYAIEGLSLLGGKIVAALTASLKLDSSAVSFLISHGDPNLAHFEAAREIIETRIHSGIDAKAVTSCAKAALDLHAFMYGGIYENYRGGQRR